MAANLNKLREDALQLPEPERADLAAELLASLAAPSSDLSEEQWIAEVERRARTAMAGGAGLSWDQVQKRIRRELSKK